MLLFKRGSTVYVRSHYTCKNLSEEDYHIHMLLWFACGHCVILNKAHTECTSLLGALYYGAILANIYETHRCLLNITSLMQYLVNIDPLLATSVRYLANIASRHTDAIFTNIASKCTHAMFATRGALMRYLANIASSPFWNGISGPRTCNKIGSDYE